MKNIYQLAILSLLAIFSSCEKNVDNEPRTYNIEISPYNISSETTIYTWFTNDRNEVVYSLEIQAQTPSKIIFPDSLNDRRYNFHFLYKNNYYSDWNQLFSYQNIRLGDFIYKKRGSSIGDDIGYITISYKNLPSYNSGTVSSKYNTFIDKFPDEMRRYENDDLLYIQSGDKYLLKRDINAWKDYIIDFNDVKTKTITKDVSLGDRESVTYFVDAYLGDDYYSSKITVDGSHDEQSHNIIKVPKNEIAFKRFIYAVFFKPIDDVNTRTYSVYYGSIPKVATAADAYFTQAYVSSTQALFSTVGNFDMFRISFYSRNYWSFYGSEANNITFPTLPTSFKDEFPNFNRSSFASNTFYQANLYQDDSVDGYDEYIKKAFQRNERMLLDDIKILRVSSNIGRIGDYSKKNEGNQIDVVDYLDVEYLYE